MNLKGIGILTFLFFMLIPISTFAEIIESPKPFNYKNGLLDDYNVFEAYTGNEIVFDNDTSTSVMFNKGRTEVFFLKYPVNIQGLYYKRGNSTLSNNIVFVLNNGENIRYEAPSTNKIVEEYIDLDIKDVVMISMGLSNTYSFNLYEVDFFGKYDDSVEPINHNYDNYNNVKFIESTEMPTKVKNINHSVTESSIKLDYELPNEFDYIEIDVNGQIYNTTNNSYTIENLDPDTTYEIKIKTVLNDIKSEGVTLTVKTDKELPQEKEVSNVKANTKHNRVDLSWDLPESEEFEHVTIYRKMLENKTSSIFNWLVPKTFASDPYDPIFETNGTYFNDLTVESATDYEYKLTSTHDGKETPGVTVQATTAPPIVEGGKVTETPEGDFIYSWNAPTTGQVKIYVNGEEYATADASDGKITIPADDMVYNGFGDPLVTSQAIAPNGTPGNIANGGGTLDSINLPFTVNDLLTSGNGLLYLVGSFVLLAISLLFIPRLIRLIRESFNSYRNTNNYSSNRRARL